MRVVERKFRGSVVCRVLGYPVSYGMVKLLLERGAMNLEDLATAARRAKSTTCTHLTKLRLANIVRYEKKGLETLYWVKYRNEVRRILRACESLVRRASRRLGKDV